MVFHAVSKRNGAGRGISPLPPTLLKQIGKWFFSLFFTPLLLYTYIPAASDLAQQSKSVSTAVVCWAFNFIFPVLLCIYIAYHLLSCSWWYVCTSCNNSNTTTNKHKQPDIITTTTTTTPTPTTTTSTIATTTITTTSCCCFVLAWRGSIDAYHIDHITPQWFPGGRAGRHGKGYDFGEVTCLRAADMQYMNKVSTPPAPFRVFISQVGVRVP